MPAKIITTPSGDYAMRVVRISPGQYWLDVNTRPIVCEVFLASLRIYYEISQIQMLDGNLTLRLVLAPICYYYERSHLFESLYSLYDGALSVHQGAYYFRPRLAF